MKQHTHTHTQMHLHSHQHITANTSTFKLSLQATLHCLTGCAIGELIGLSIGVSLGWPATTTMLLATLLGFMSGYLLGLWPLVKQGHSWLHAFKLIWLGETISIAVMEFVMNAVDYNMGGMQAPSIFHSQFWLGYLIALPAGFIAAWPVNYWLLKRNLKKSCH